MLFLFRMFFKIPPFVFHRIKAIATVLERHHGEQNDDRIVIFVRTIALNVLSICLLYLNCVIIPSETLFYAYTVCCIHIIVIWRRILGIFLCLPRAALV